MDQTVQPDQLQVSGLTSNDGYSMYHFQHMDTVMIPITNESHEISRETKQNADIAWCVGFLACFCCIIPIGILSLFFANQASKDFSKGKLKSGIYYRRVSYLLSLTSAVLGIVALIIVMHYMT